VKILQNNNEKISWFQKIAQFFGLLGILPTIAMILWPMIVVLVPIIFISWIIFQVPTGAVYTVIPVEEIQTLVISVEIIFLLLGMVLFFWNLLLFVDLNKQVSIVQDGPYALIPNECFSFQQSYDQITIDNHNIFYNRTAFQ
jgi:hypothetical protein